jgi:hypothetical protein
MTVVKKGSVIRKVKNIGVNSALIVALTAGGWLLPSCTSSNSGEEYSYEEVSYSQGVVSHIKEVKPGEFQITDEESVPMSDAKAIVSYLDGHTDTLSVETSRALIDKEISNGAEYGMNSGLTSMLLYGGMGYMMGRMLGGGGIAQQRQKAGNTSGVYGSQAAYNKSQTAMRNVDASRTARTVKSRPANSRSGFMGAKGGRSVGG